MNNATVLEINADAIKHNVTHFKSKLHPNTKILAVVKAFAYGSDACILSKILQDENVDYLAVAYTDEGVSLRNAGIDLPILVLHPQIINFNALIAHNLEPNIYSKNILNAFLKISKSKNLTDYPIHIKFNTGLNRLGFNVQNLREIFTLITKENSIHITSVFSHLAASEDLNENLFTKNQIASFRNIKIQIEEILNYKPIFHLLNTSGILNYPQAQFDMVRLGIGLFGFDNAFSKNLKNVLTLKSIISQIHTLKKGDSVGYNRAFVCSKNSKIATIPIGHADGISRKLGNGIGSVLINKQKVPIIGNVCMDMLMVDISNIDCNEGDMVILFDSQKRIEEISQKINTIPYELLTMISQRVKRIKV